MIKIEKIDTWGFEHAIRGMRNPMNSWDRSDSKFNDCNSVGENDLSLMYRLYKAGSEHRKYLRQIFVSMDITAPLYWWKEFDTYKVGTVANSTSTMHKIHTKEFTLEDFSCEHLEDAFPGTFIKICDNHITVSPRQLLDDFIIPVLNHNRNEFIETKDKKYWWQMIQLLPSSYNQKRTITMNYENAVSMIKQRAGHKLDEWNEFVAVLNNLPYMEEITR